MRDAKRSPLVDFNFGEDDIPKVLLVAVADTYAVPTPVECDVLAAEIESIDMALGRIWMHLRHPARMRISSHTPSSRPFAV